MARFGLMISFDDVAMAGAIAVMVLVGAAVGWQQLGMTGSVDCIGDRVDAVACHERSGGWRAKVACVHVRG